MGIRAYAATEANGPLKAFSYEPGELRPTDVEIKVTHCGICHSDLSMRNNEWMISNYPLVPGHEVVGTVHAVGNEVKHLAIGQQVGLGWNADSCMTCEWCAGGDHNLCGEAQGTIVGRHGGFADRVRAHHQWVLALPEGLDPAQTAPLLCGGITVYNPLVAFDVSPQARVGVIGIGGLGHMAIRFAHAWGCEVTALSGSPSKEQEAREMGAAHFLNSRDADALKQAAGHFDLVISTVNAALPWKHVINTLRPKGNLCLVGATLDPIPVQAMQLIGGQRQISGNPTGPPATMRQMLQFAARHKIGATVQTYPMSQVNEALDALQAGKARYRIVLESDF